MGSRQVFTKYSSLCYGASYDSKVTVITTPTVARPETDTVEWSLWP